MAKIIDTSGTPEINPKYGLLVEAPATPVPINAGLGTPDLRSVISQTPGKGLIQGYDTQNNYNPVYVPQGKYVPGISLTNKNLTTDKMTSAGGITLPDVPQPGLDQAGGLVAGAGATVDTITEALTPSETPTETKQRGFLNDIASLTQELGQKGVDQLSAEQAGGIPELKTQFANINSQIKTKMAEYEALQSQNKNRPVTMSSIIGSERAILDARASDIGLLQSRAYALQGQLELAQETANRSVDLKYSSLEAKLNTYEAQLRALQPTLNKEEKIQALAQQTLLDQEKQRVADKKQTEKEIQNIMLSSVQSGLSDVNIINQISSAKSIEEATRIAAPSLSAEGKLNLQIKKAELNKKAPGIDTGISLGGVFEGKQIDFNNPDVVNKLPISTLTKAIISGYGTTKDLTPTDKSAVISELYKVGYDPKKYVLDKLDNLVTQLEKVSPYQRGVVQGYTPATWSDEASAFESAKVVMTRQLARLYDVGMLSDQDVADYKKAMPSRTDWSISSSKAKVKGLKEAIGAVGLQSTNQTSVLTSPDGKSQVKISELTPAQLEEAKKAGWK